MKRIETIKDFYKRKIGWLPDNFRQEIGHFNVFNLTPYVGENAEAVPYIRRDFYKVMLVKGQGKVHYANQSIEVKQQALSFSNPQIPYKWENTNHIEGGFFCIFNDDFFRQFGNIKQYAVFNPQGSHIFELSDEQATEVQSIFERMFSELQSNYAYKYDVLRNLAFELIHFAMKLEPSVELKQQGSTASQRISKLFLELLERQFPIDEQHTVMTCRSASDFAKQLNIHVNHLNKAMKETAQKTTSQIIAERLLHEAKILLQQRDWNISKIAFALGFTEVSHFNHFFKKHTALSPSKFRNNIPL